MSTNVKNIDTRTKYLVYGYVNCLKIKHQLTPSSIIVIIILFFYSKSFIVYFHGNGSTSKRQISIVDMKKNTNYELNLNRINYCLHSGQRDYTAAVNSGICFVQDIYLPKQIIKQNNYFNNKSVYNVIFIVYSYKSGSAYIFDENLIYYYKLPSLNNESLG